MEKCLFILSEKIVLTEKITLKDWDDLISNNNQTVHFLNTCFSNIVTSLKVPEYAKCDPFSNNSSDPIIKSMVKYRNHPCILATGELSNKTHESPILFSNRGRKEILLEIYSLSPLKTGQDTDIPTRIIKIDPYVLTDFIHSSSTTTSKVSFFSKTSRCNSSL